MKSSSKATAGPLLVSVPLFLVLAAHGLIAALRRDDTSAVLDVARFPADGMNRPGLSAQGCLAARLAVAAGQVAQDAQRCAATR